MNKAQWYKIVEKRTTNNNERIIDALSLNKITQTPYSLEDQKIVLNGSEILEKLNVIIKNIDAKSSVNNLSHGKEDNNACLFLKYCFNYKKIVIYHAKLRKLLTCRYLLFLKQEHEFCVKRNEELYKKSFSLTLFGKQDGRKLSNVFSSKLANSDCFIESESTILINQLKKMIQRWQSLFLNFQKVSTIFQPGFDIQLYNIFIFTDFYLYCLYDRFIHFISTCLHIISERFSFSDLNDSTIDFLPKVLDIFETFKIYSLYHKNNRNGLHCCNLLTRSFRALKMIELQEFSCSYMLSFFGQLQARLAADRIMRVITIDVQKQIISSKYFFNWISSTSLERKYNDDTSDYFSGSTSETHDHNMEHFNPSHVKVLPKISASSTLMSVINSLQQKNESFILKYLLTIKQQNSNQNYNLNESSIQNNINISTVPRKSWKFNAKMPKNRSCSELKKIYWLKFWNKAYQHFIKLLVEVPYQQVGEYFSGSILMCRKSFAISLTKYLNDNFVSYDYSSDSQNYLRRIYNYTFLYAAKVEWDKRFCAALAATHFLKYSAVPLEGGLYGTFSGNALYVMLQPLLAVLKIYQSFFSDIAFFYNAFHQLLSSMYFLRNCLIIKEQNIISSWNIQQYSLISCDIMRFVQLTNVFIPFEDFKSDFSQQFSYLMPFLENSLQQFTAIQDELKEFDYKILQIMRKKAYVSCLDIISQVLSMPSWKFTRCVTKPNCIYQIIEEIMEPLSGSTELNGNQLNLVKAVHITVIESYCITVQKRKLRSREVQLMIDDVGELSSWIKRMNLFSNKDDRTEIFHLLDNLFRTLNTLSSNNFYNQRLARTRNSVYPLMQPSEFLQ